MDARIAKIRDKLNKIKGLRVLFTLEEEQKDIIRDLEEERNKGVFECLDREYTMLLAHDSSFRKPDKKIVKGKGKDIIFPGVPFHEVNAKNVVSSSPSGRVHRALMEMLHVHLDEEDATLLVGFDLE